MSDILRELQQKIQRRQAVVVLGAGVTAMTTDGHPVSTWTGLLQHGVSYCEEHVQGLLPGWADRTREDIASGDPDDMIIAAEKITRKLASRANLGEWLRSSIGQLRVVCPDVIQAVVSLGLPIITTNYDDLLERQTGWTAVHWQDEERARRVLVDEEPGIVHLHGFFEDPDTVVLDIRSYERILNYSPMRAMLEATAIYKSFLFVGFGAGLEDPNFSRLRVWMRDVLARLTNRHYRLCTSGDRTRLAEVHKEDTSLRLVEFGNEPGDLAEYILRELAAQTHGLDTAVDAARAAPPTSEVTGTAGALPQDPERTRHLTTVSVGRMLAGLTGGVTADDEAAISAAIERHAPELAAALQRLQETA